MELGLAELITKFWYGIVVPIGIWVYRVESSLHDVKAKASASEKNRADIQNRLETSFKEHREDMKEIRTDIKKILSGLSKGLE